MTKRYRCTECDALYSTLAKAARCHWGIGGVAEVEVYKAQPITAESILAAKAEVINELTDD